MEYMVTASAVVDDEDQTSTISSMLSETITNLFKVGTIKAHSIRVVPLNPDRETSVDDKVMSLTGYLTAPVALKVLEEFIRKSDQWKSSPSSSENPASGIA